MGCATAPACALGLHSKESELYNACAFLKYTGSLTPDADLHRFNRQKRSSVSPVTPFILEACKIRSNTNLLHTGR
jgi:hypothetical protein